MLKYSLNILLAIVIISCSKPEKNNEVSNQINSGGITIEPVFFEPVVIDDITIYGHYPKISNLKNKELEENLNKLFIDNVNYFIDDNVENMVNASVSFEILTLNDSILSLTQQSSGMVDGTGTSAGIRLDVVTVNADIKKGKILTNEDLNVNKVGLSHFNKTVNSFFRKICGFTDMFWEEYISNPKSEQEMMKLHFGIKDGNLVELEFGTPCSFATRGIYLIPIAKIGLEFQIQTGSTNVLLNSSDTAKIISEVTGGLQKEMQGQFKPKDGNCDSIVSCNLEFFDLDYDNYPEVKRTYYGSVKCFGPEKSKTVILKKDKNGNWKEIFEESNKGYTTVLGSFYNGFSDLILTKDTISTLLRWNGSKYVEEQITEIAFKYTESKSGIVKKEAVKQVTDWIENLGKRDFRSAYDKMSPSIRGDFESFSSVKKYGGITGTKVYSEDIYSYKVSDCVFEVTVTYDSYDPSNSNGKFTDRFSINNCKGNWEISSIKRIFKEKL